MKMTLIIVPKTDLQNKRIVRIVRINSLISKVFSNEINNGIITIKGKNEVDIVIKHDCVSLNYTVVQKEKMLLMDIMTEHENASSMKAMEYFCSKISNCEQTKDLNVIRAYDEPSQILCSRLYKPLTQFERLLRKLVYEIVVKAYGSSWCKETLESFNHNEEFRKINDEIKKRSNQDRVNRIEAALEEMDYENLIKYLFSKKPSKDYSEIIEEDLASEKISSMSKEQIIEIVNAARPMSLWNRLFYDYKELNDLESDISIIKGIRNKVMHSKRVKYSEYQTLHRLLLKWNPLIESAISKNEEEEYTPFQSINIIQSLNELKDLFRTITMPSSNVVNSCINEISKTLSQGLKDVYKIIGLNTNLLSRNLLSLRELASGMYENRTLNDGNNSDEK